MRATVKMASFRTCLTLGIFVVCHVANCFDVRGPTMILAERNLHHIPRRLEHPSKIILMMKNKNEESSANEWTSDFDDYVGSDDTEDPSSFFDINELLKQKKQQETSPQSTDVFSEVLSARPAAALFPDYTACRTRQLLLGKDFILQDFVGNMGFDEVTDWEYYYPSEDDRDEERQVVTPNPFDSSKPKRTRTSSGSVVRIFRGECIGSLGGALSSQGLDKRIVVKEFSGKLALSLAQSELLTVGKLQSDLVATIDEMAVSNLTWINSASARSVMLRRDNTNLCKLVRALGDAPFLGILGEVNLAELEDVLEANEFYRSLGVPPPPQNAIWIVYEYAGFSTIQTYAVPPAIRVASLPPKRGFFGNLIPQTIASLPPYKNRVAYVQGIMKRSIDAVATLHEAGFVHRSIGRASLVLSTSVMDKREAASPFNTMTAQLVIKLADFGFSCRVEDCRNDDEFCARARTFGLNFDKTSSIAATNFAIAEDMHALGFVFLALLLTSLAQLPEPEYPIPATDEDTLQRLLGEIFDKDMNQFRDYVEAEEVWSDLVSLLDDKDAAGWTVLETLMLAREKAVERKDTDQIFTLRGLLSNPFFS